MPQAALKHRASPDAFRELLGIVQTAFGPARLHGFVFCTSWIPDQQALARVRDDTFSVNWAFGRDLSLFPLNALCQQYSGAEHTHQYVDVVYKDRGFKVFDLPLCTEAVIPAKAGTQEKCAAPLGPRFRGDDKSFLLFIFEASPDEDDIFSVIRFKQAYEEQCDDRSIVESLQLLRQQIFGSGRICHPHVSEDPLCDSKMDPRFPLRQSASVASREDDKVPDYLKSLFLDDTALIWGQDNEPHEVRKSIGLPLSQLAYCDTVLGAQRIKNTIIAQNDTGQKLQALTLKPAEDWAFLTALPFPAAIIDDQFLIHAINREWHAILKRTCGTLRTFIPNQDMTRLAQAFDGGPMSLQSAVRYAPHLFMEWHVRPFGALYLLTAVPQKSQECTLQHMKSLEEHNLLLKQFAHLCAHDLKEPLRAITSYVQLLLRKPEKQDQYAGFIIDSCHNLKNLIDGILIYSTCDGDDERYQLLNMNEVIDTALAYLKPKIEEKNATIRWDPHNPIYIKGNKVQLVQVFQNIIDNAIKFTTEKPVIHISYRLKDGRHVFKVRDFGIGIPEHLVRKTFNLFTRLNDKSKFSGSGIGLALCKKIVEFHKGTLTIAAQSPGIEVCIVL